MIAIKYYKKSLFTEDSLNLLKLLIYMSEQDNLIRFFSLFIEIQAEYNEEEYFEGMVEININSFFLILLLLKFN